MSRSLSSHASLRCVHGGYDRIDVLLSEGQVRVFYLQMRTVSPHMLVPFVFTCGSVLKVRCGRRAGSPDSYKLSIKDCLVSLSADPTGPQAPYSTVLLTTLLAYDALSSVRVPLPSPALIPINYVR